MSDTKKRKNEFLDQNVDIERRGSTIVPPDRDWETRILG